MDGRDPLRLTKHHGAGNDFLVLVDAEDRHPVDAALAAALCDRHRGVGADGILRARPAAPGASRASGDAAPAVVMELRNADGSPAEMSGNGIRCLVQAVVEAGVASPPEVVVATAAGLRQVTYRPGASGEGWASVDMGVPRLEGPPAPGSPAASPAARRQVGRVELVDLGNPHLVAEVEDPWSVDLERLAAALGGDPVALNVELVAAVAHDRLALRVVERGVGPTLACGTGSCAAAAAARAWGLVGEHVFVDNPGGTLEVMLGRGADGQAVLAGLVRRVAEVLVDPEALAAAPQTAGWRAAVPAGRA